MREPMASCLLQATGYKNGSTFSQRAQVCWTDPLRDRQRPRVEGLHPHAPCYGELPGTAGRVVFNNSALPRPMLLRLR